MATLTEKIRERKSPAGGQTEAARRLMQAKSGKVASTLSAPISTESEKAENQAAGGSLSQLANQQRMQSGMADVQDQGMEQAAREQRDQLKMQQAVLDEQQEQAFADIQSFIEREAEKLGVDKDQANLEARLFARSINSKEYIQDLKNTAALENAVEEAAFTKQILKSTLGNRTSILMDELNINRDLDKSEAQWRKDMASIDINTALAAANASISDANNQAAWSGATNAVAGGVDYAMTPAKKKTSTDAEEE